MNDILFNAQQAIVDVLEPVLDGTASIYDHVPQEAAFPYVVCGPVHVEPYDTLTENGLEQIVTLNIWSHYRGSKETHEIFQTLYNTLHRATLTVTGHVFVLCAFDSADFSLDADGLTYHAAVRFTLVTQSE